MNVKQMYAAIGMLLLFFGCAQDKEQVKKEVTCLKMSLLKHEFDRFKLDNGVYPDTKEGFGALVRNPDAKKYQNYRPHIKKLPMDAWGIPLVYIKKSDRKIEIISYASDRKKGGEGTGKDILLSECEK